jgi:hypothetical protein
MKFAVAALVAVVAAKKKQGKKWLEEDLLEDVKVTYPADTVHEWMKGMWEIEQVGEEMRDQIREEHPHMRQELKEFARGVAARYGEEFMGWAHSPTVQAVEAHKMAMMASSKELHTVMSDIFTLYMEFAHGGVDMGYGFNKDGSYTEHMSNKSARHVFEELYKLAQDIRKLAESPMARNQKRLERLTLNDPHFQKMFSMLQDDTDIHSWEELGARLQHLAEEVKDKLSHCEHFQKVVGILHRLHTMVERTRVVEDLDLEGYASWWNESHFENPFEGFDPMDDHEEELEELAKKLMKKKGLKKEVAKAIVKKHVKKQVAKKIVKAKLAKKFGKDEDEFLI